MSDSVALRAWRRRAQGAHAHGHAPSWKAVVAAASACLAFTVLGGTLGGRRTAVPASTPAAGGPPACAPLASPLHADIDGDGCDEAVSFADGALTTGPVRMRVGAPGYQVALGRWTCGPVIVALLRPGTGEVFRFDSWATQATSVSAVVLGRVQGAVGIRAASRDG